MAIKALDLTKITRYTVKGDDPEDPTIWHLGTLTSREVGMIRDGATTFTVNTADAGSEDEGDVDTRVEQSKMNFEACRLGIKGWDNFIGPDGEPIPFGDQEREIAGKRKRVVRPELLDRIPLSVITELGQKIISDNTPTEKEAGNSKEPSSGG